MEQRWTWENITQRMLRDVLKYWNGSRCKKCFDLEPQKFLDGLQRIGVTQPLGINLVGEGIPKIYPQLEKVIGLDFRLHRWQ